MVLDFYYMPASGPCRSVLMAARELNIPLNLKSIDLMKGEQNTPEFIAINPQHCVPTLHDTETGFALWESRAILAYLVNKYSPGHSLYPTDPEKRANVDRLLYFDIGTLYTAQAAVIYPTLFGKGTVDDEKRQAFKDKLALLEGFLEGSSYVAGDTLTLADLAILASISFNDVLDYDFSPYANITAWRQRLSSELPYNKEINDDPIAGFKAWFESQKTAATA